MALTVGLLAFLAIDATLEGLELAGEGSQAFGGAALVFLGALVAYLLLSGVAAWLRPAARGGQRRRRLGRARSRCWSRSASACTTSARASRSARPTRSARSRSGAFLVVGFALHNTTEGLAIVAPVADLRPSLRRLALLGLIAGAPAMLGAWIGAAAFNSSVAAFLFGFGAGAIVQVIVQLAPSLRDERAARCIPRPSAACWPGSR